MKAQQTVFDLIKDSMGHSSIMAVAGDMIPFANNSFDNARFLSQLLFWIDDREDWVPIPFKEWKTVAKMSRYSIEKARYFFYSMGVLEYKVKKDSKGNPTAHYKLNFKALMKELNKFFKSAKTLILSSFADCLKSKRGQDKKESVTRTYPQYKESLEPKSVGQHSKKETKKKDKGRYDKFY